MQGRITGEDNLITIDIEDPGATVEPLFDVGRVSGSYEGDEHLPSHRVQSIADDLHENGVYLSIVDNIHMTYLSNSSTMLPQ